jgi:hypothetical protein
MSSTAENGNKKRNTTLGDWKRNRSFSEGIKKKSPNLCPHLCFFAVKSEA